MHWSIIDHSQIISPCTTFCTLTKRIVFAIYFIYFYLFYLFLSNQTYTHCPICGLYFYIVLIKIEKKKGAPHDNSGFCFSFRRDIDTILRQQHYAISRCMPWRYSVDRSCRKTGDSHKKSTGQHISVWTARIKICSSWSGYYSSCYDQQPGSWDHYVLYGWYDMAW